MIYQVRGTNYDWSLELIDFPIHILQSARPLLCDYPIVNRTS